MNKEEMIERLNKFSEAEGCASWSQVLRDFDVSPDFVSGIIFSFVSSVIDKSESEIQQLEPRITELEMENLRLRGQNKKMYESLEYIRDLDVRIKPGVQWVFGHVIGIAEQALKP